MTTDDLVNIYRIGSRDSHTSGLRSVFNAGWYAAKGTTPTSNSADQVGQVATIAAANVVVSSKRK